MLSSKINRHPIWGERPRKRGGPEGARERGMAYWVGRCCAVYRPCSDAFSSRFYWSVCTGWACSCCTTYLLATVHEFWKNICALIGVLRVCMHSKLTFESPIKDWNNRQHPGPFKQTCTQELHWKSLKYTIFSLMRSEISPPNNLTAPHMTWHFLGL